MKIILCIGIIIMTTLTAKILADKYIYREKFFLELVEFSKEIERNIRLLKEPINKIKRKDGGYVEKILADINSVDEIGFLSDKEKENVKSFFQSFGKSDSVLEQKRVELFCEELNDKLKVVEAEKLKKAPLYIKLGLVVGSFIVIVLV
ncbi:MAG: stage III sporulation protein AB [Clostridia bacterium]